MPRNPRCQLCSLNKGVVSVCVWGEAQGKRPDIFILGEAPGREEDALARPFVGASGKALRTVLQEMNLLDRSYITNVCKCRPPDNRTPKLPEMRACAPYWREELSAMRPKAIVLLGSSAMRAFTGERKVNVGEYRGKKAWTYTEEGWLNPARVIGTYHPAACLRTAELWPKVVDDLSRIDAEDPLAEEIKWSVWDGQTKIPTTIALDVETTGLNPFIGDGRILSIAWSNRTGRAVVTEDVDRAVEELNRRARTIIGHNLKFDLLWLRKHGFVHEHHTLIDTLGMFHLLDENAPSHGLKYLASQMTGLGDWAKEVEQFRSSGTMDQMVPMKLLEYNAWDAGATWMVYQRMLPEIREQGLSRHADFHGRLVHTLVDTEARGLLVSAKEMRKYRKELIASTEVLERNLTETLGEFEPDSPKQLGALLHGKLRLPVVKRTPTGQPSVDEDALTMLSKMKNDYHDVLEWLLLRRKNKKMLSTYVDGLEKSIGDDGAIHPSFNLAGTVTGRFSCSAPNLQNIPHDKAGPKRMFVARPGYLLVEIDYSQIELRIGAMLSEDAQMLAAFRQGRDLHLETAKAIFNGGRDLEESEVKEKRRLAKTINFGIFYGMGADHLAKDTGLSMQEARKYLAKWFSTYDGVKAWLLRTESTVLADGAVTSMFGRRRRLPTIVASKEAQARAIRQACNFPVQSSASELTLMAMIVAAEFVPVVGNIHDAILLEVEEGQLRYVEEIVGLMSNPQKLVKEFGWTLEFPIPFPVEVKTGRSWGTLEER